MKTTTTEQRGISFTRLLAAVCTFGLSVPVWGVRRRRRTVTRVTP